MIKLNIKNADGSPYGFILVKDMPEAFAYIEQCKSVGSLWTAEKWVRLEDGDPRINDKIAKREVVEKEGVPAVEEVKDQAGAVLTPEKPAVPPVVHTEYNLGCYVEFEDVGDEPLLAELRVERNKKLEQCDWTQLQDAPLSEAKKAEWAQYRKALRDLPSAEGLDLENVSWPVQPLK